MGKWIKYPWMKDQGLDDLIHPEDLGLLNQLEGIGICYQVDESQDWLTLFFRQYKFRVSKINSGIKYLPQPKFVWDEYVQYKKNIYQIDHISWHHRDQQYYYSLRGRKSVKKRIFDNDLTSIYNRFHSE